jgi:hypothetical protein
MMNDNIELLYTKPQLKLFFDIPTGIKYVIITKGRRFGLTHGASHACIEWMIEGRKILWGDTIHGNIDRYFERYFTPALKKNEIAYKYYKQDKKLFVEDGYIDFRSADHPENWEGFGYDYIFLNEAGIILNNKYLYTNAVLPMLMDSPDSVLIAGGVPKGKFCRGLKNKDEEHPFFTIYKEAKSGKPRYLLHEYTSYDNPKLDKEQIAELEQDMGRMSAAMVEQEIYGKFVDSVSGVLWTSDMFKHVDNPPHLKRIVVGVDPSGSTGRDEVGIISGGIDERGNIYVLTDLSGQYSPYKWGSTTVSEYNRLGANDVVAETNYGGKMVVSTIHNVNKMIRVKEVHASRGKEIRAEPVVALYEQGKIYHALGLDKLETEMCTWVPGIGKSPNRVDALVWMITDLMGNKTENWVV